MHPKFQGVLAEIRSLPPSERLQAVLTQLTPEALVTRGIQIPEECTITTHVLHDSGFINANDALATQVERKAELCFKVWGQEICITSEPPPLDVPE